MVARWEMSSLSEQDLLYVASSDLFFQRIRTRTNAGEKKNTHFSQLWQMPESREIKYSKFSFVVVEILSHLSFLWNVRLWAPTRCCCYCCYENMKAVINVLKGTCDTGKAARWSLHRDRRSFLLVLEKILCDSLQQCHSLRVAAIKVLFPPSTAAVSMLFFIYEKKNVPTTPSPE